MRVRPVGIPLAPVVILRIGVGAPPHVLDRVDPGDILDRKEPDAGLDHAYTILPRLHADGNGFFVAQAPSGNLVCGVKHI